jgi:hypothetical protein
MAHAKSHFFGVMLPLFLVASGFASSPLTADQAKLLGAAQSFALQYIQELPDFIYAQIAHREISPLN